MRVAKRVDAVAVPAKSHPWLTIPHAKRVGTIALTTIKDRGEKPPMGFRGDDFPRFRVGQATNLRLKFVELYV